MFAWQVREHINPFLLHKWKVGYLRHELYFTSPKEGSNGKNYRIYGVRAAIPA